MAFQLVEAPARRKRFAIIWPPLFSGVAGINAAAAERFLQHAQTSAGEVHCLSFDEFAEVARHVNRSSPGPDGVPYQAWLGGGGFPLRLVYEAYVAVTEGAKPPAEFNPALLAFIPKGGSLPGTDGYEGRAPEYRPLTLSNSCRKLVTKTMGVALEHIAMALVPRPRGAWSSAGRCL